MQYHDIDTLEWAVNQVLSGSEGKIKPHVYTGTPKRHFNCWGFTAKACGWISEEDWLYENDMECFLECNTKHIKETEAKEGDIVVYRATAASENLIYGDTEGTLLHTSILCDRERNLVIQKPGECQIEVEPVDGRYTKNYLASVEFRRVIHTVSQHT